VVVLIVEFVPGAEFVWWTSLPRDCCCSEVGHHQRTGCDVSSILACGTGNDARDYL